MKEIKQRESLTEDRMIAMGTWYAPLTKETTFSKYFSIAIFIILPFVGFVVGVGYGGEIIVLDNNNLFADGKNQDVHVVDLKCNSAPSEQFYGEYSPIVSENGDTLLVVSYYYDREGANLQGRFLRDAEKYGWQDFVFLGYAPPAPVIGLEQGVFESGDLIEMTLTQGESNISGDGVNGLTTGAYNVVSAKKLPIPSQNEIFAHATEVVMSNVAELLHCAGAEKFGTFQITNNTLRQNPFDVVDWNPHTNTAYVNFSYSGTPKDCSGEFQQLSISLRFNQELELIDTRATTSCGIYTL